MQEHHAIRAIVEATQAALHGGIPPEPPLPTLTLDPVAASAPTTGQLVGPFAVGGSVSSSTLVTAGVEVFADADGAVPLADGATVAQGTDLWARYAAGASGTGFSVSSVQSVVEGSVFIYDGANRGRVTAQKLILAQEVHLPLRAVAAITPYPASTLRVEVDVTGAAAGRQGEVRVAARCAAGAVVTTGSGTLPARTAEGVSTVLNMAPLAAGATCTVSQTADGADDGAVLQSTTIAPESVTIADRTTSVVTVSDVFTAPPPSPRPSPPAPSPPAASPPAPAPTPTHAALPDTGGNVGVPWMIPLGLVAAGATLVLVGAHRRRNAE